LPIYIYNAARIAKYEQVVASRKICRKINIKHRGWFLGVLNAFDIETEADSHRWTPHESRHYLLVPGRIKIFAIIWTFGMYGYCNDIDARPPLRMNKVECAALVFEGYGE
jgi:hypothetical protein